MAKDRERIRRWQNLDFYAVLGITTDSSATEVRKGFRMVAKTCHPDKVPPEQREHATKHFQLIAEAYEVLNCDVTRREYDEARRKAGFPAATGRKAPNKPPACASAGGPKKPSGAQVHFTSQVHRCTGTLQPGQHWSWPAWCLDGKAPCIEVLVLDGPRHAEWVKATPRTRITDPETGRDTHLNAHYRWRGDEYREDFGPDRVRRRGDVITIAELVRQTAATGSPRRGHETQTDTSKPDQQGDPGTREPAPASSKSEPDTERREASSENEGDETVDRLDILMTMGFEESQARAALERCTSLEAAVEHIMAQGAVAARFGVIAPAVQGFYDAIIEPAAKYIHGDPKAAALTSRLVELGFDETQAIAAAQRCSSVEAAVEWLEGK